MKDMQFSNKLYVKKHGSEPCGTGNWAFMVEGEDDYVYAPYGLTLPEAKRWVKENFPAATYASAVALKCV